MTILHFVEQPQKHEQHEQHNKVGFEAQNTQRLNCALWK
jgi:hypothetical protein